MIQHHSQVKSKYLFFLFILLYDVASVAIVGILPSIILLFGIFQLKKNKDFSSVEVSTNIVQSLLILAIVAALIMAIIKASSSYEWDSRQAYFEAFFMTDAVFGFFWAGIASFYYIITKVMFFNVLERHKKWIEQNGIFSKTPKHSKVQKSSFDLIKSEKLKQFSVADELLKWAKLKEDGHISAEEFDEMRKKLLHKQD